MKKGLKLLTSIAVLGVLAGAYAGVKIYNENNEQTEADNSETIAESNIFSASSEDLKSIAFLIDKKEVVFEKEDDQWLMSGDKDFPIDQTIMEEAESTILSVYSQKTIEDVTDLSQYGLDVPSNTIRLELEDSEQTFRIGDANASTGQYYMRMNEDESTVYMIDAAVAEAFAKELYDYAQADVFPDIISTDIKEVKVQKQEGSYVLQKEEETGFWNVGDDVKMEKADSAKAGTVTSSISAMEYEKFIHYDCEDMGEYGLDQPYAEIIIDYTEETEVEEDSEKIDETTETAPETAEETADEEMVQVEKQLIIHVGNETSDHSRYISLDDSTAVYTISEESLGEIIDSDKSFYWDMNVCYLSVNQLETAIVTDEQGERQISVSRETSETEDDESAETITYQMNGEDVDSTVFTTFYNKLINLAGERRLLEVYTPASESAFGVELTDIDGKSMKVEFYEYDSNYYAAVIEEKVYLVNKMDVKDMIDAYSNL